MKKYPKKKYNQIFKESAERRKLLHSNTECGHELWIKRCSTCGEILSADSRLEEEFKDRKIFYNNFDKSVCSYSSATLLKKVGIRQNSTLFYVYTEHNDSLAICSKENLFASSENYSAFTVQELFRMIIYRLPGDKLTDKEIINIAKHGDNPTYLAKIIIKRHKHGDKIRSRI